MINFHIPEIADKPKIDAAFFNSNCRSDDYCFGNLFIWRNHFKTRVAFLGELPLVAFDDGPHNLARYLFPIGNGNKKEAIHILFEQPDARRPFTFAGVTDEMKMEIEELFPEKFSFELNRN
ncbi:MAG TPA: hypothetical protein DEP42_06335, partial [Ruminococcaceae bacterium]|nr:hypothetical protein [Oscillospiraceae bacterium]